MTRSREDRTDALLRWKAAAVLSFALHALLLTGCHEDLKAERRLAALSRGAAQACLAKPQTCAAVAKCQALASAATVAYQAHLDAVARKSSDAPQRLAAARDADTAAQAECSRAGIKPSTAPLSPSPTGPAVAPDGGTGAVAPHGPEAVAPARSVAAPAGGAR